MTLKEFRNLKDSRRFKNEISSLEEQLGIFLLVANKKITNSQILYISSYEDC